jgi:hypothetical protein
MQLGSLMQKKALAFLLIKNLWKTAPFGNIYLNKILTRSNPQIQK